MIKVQKKIKIPEVQSGRRRKYPWGDLKIGDSFFVPNYRHNIHGVLAGYNNHSGKDPIKITTRKEKGGLRVWRIA